MSFLNEIHDTSGSVSELDTKILDESIEVLQEIQDKVQFSAKTKKKRMLHQAELLVAKDEYPALFAKYAKATKLRKKYRALIHVQCNAKAKQRLRMYLQRQKNAASAPSPTPKSEKNS